MMVGRRWFELDEDDDDEDGGGGGERARDDEDDADDDAEEEGCVEIKLLNLVNRKAERIERSRTR